MYNAHSIRSLPYSKLVELTLIIDIDNPVISKEFVQTPFNPVSEEVLYKYSVAGLVDDLFNNM